MGLKGVLLNPHDMGYHRSYGTVLWFAINPQMCTCILEGKRGEAWHFILTREDGTRGILRLDDHLSSFYVGCQFSEQRMALFMTTRMYRGLVVHKISPINYKQETCLQFHRLFKGYWMAMKEYMKIFDLAASRQLRYFCSTKWFSNMISFESVAGYSIRLSYNEGLDNRGGLLLVKRTYKEI